MKKLILCLSFLPLIAFNFSLYAQSDSEFKQLLLPVEVFVGDQAEIRCVFRSAADFFPGENGLDRKELLNPFTGLEDTFSVVRSELSREGMQYTLSFFIIPWKPGFIEFPSFDLNTALGITKTQEDTGNFVIALYPVEIKSIVDKTGAAGMMPPVPPIIVPGTTYVIFGIIVALVLFLIFLLRLLFKFNSIRRRWKNYLLRRAYKKNADEAVKKIKKLNKNLKLTDEEFCAHMQKIVRKYLEFRFDRRFTAISSSAIRQVFVQVCAGQIPAARQIAVEDIETMFVRTDYIRYAHDSIDSQLYPPSEHQALLGKDERKQLCQSVIRAINLFEKPDVQGGDL